MIFLWAFQLTLCYFPRTLHRTRSSRTSEMSISLRIACFLFLNLYFKSFLIIQADLRIHKLIVSSFSWNLIFFYSRLPLLLTRPPPPCWEIYDCSFWPASFFLELTADNLHGKCAPSFQLRILKEESSLHLLPWPSIFFIRFQQLCSWTFFIGKAFIFQDNRGSSWGSFPACKSIFPFPYLFFEFNSVPGYKAAIQDCILLSKPSSWWKAFDLLIFLWCEISGTDPEQSWALLSKYRSCQTLHWNPRQTSSMTWSLPQQS